MHVGHITGVLKELFAAPSFYRDKRGVVFLFTCFAAVIFAHLAVSGALPVLLEKTMKRPPRKKHAIPQHGWLLLTNPVTRSTLGASGTQNAIREFFANNPDVNFSDRLSRLLESTTIYKALNASCNSMETMASIPTVQSQLSRQRALEIHKRVFMARSEELTNFANLRNRFEAELIAGNYGEADRQLFEIKGRHGESVWLFRSTLILMSMRDDSDGIKALARDVLQRAESGFLKFLVNAFQLIADGDSVAIHHREIVESAIKELKEAGQHESVSLISMLCSPYPFKGEEAGDECEIALQVLPLIDQYQVILEILSRRVVRWSIFSDHSTECREKQYAKFLLDKIDDQRLRSIVEFNSSEKLIISSVVGRGIFDAYESGQYREAIEQFNANKNELENPLGYVNIIAKSYAYLELEPESNAERSVLIAAEN